MMLERRFPRKTVTWRCSDGSVWLTEEQADEREMDLAVDAAAKRISLRTGDTET